jgi:hypothetical protein
VHVVKRAGLTRSAALCALAALALLAGSHASALAADDWSLNGRFLATSIGEWAQTNEVYQDEATVRSVWTISMTCTNVVTCSGRVVSDLGWDADIVITNGEYVVQRDIPGWELCGDGRTVTGHQRYRFFPVGPDGFLLPGSSVFAGFDKTLGESGGCSRNDTLRIDIPFRLERLP